MPVTLDIGNSAVKWVEWDEHHQVRKEIRYTEWENFIRAIKDQNISGIKIYISSVTDNEREKELCSVLCKKNEVIFFKTNMPVPFAVLYEPRDTLGPDRLLGVLGAWYSCRDTDVVIVDMGTCVKYSLLDREKGFTGGWISPGLNMRLKALHTYTARLPLLKEENLPSWQGILLPGTDTLSSITGGTVAGICMEIDSLSHYACSLLRNPIMMVTGGSMPFLWTWLQSMPRIGLLNEKKQIFADPLLIHRGLLYYFEAK